MRNAIIEILVLLSTFLLNGLFIFLGARVAKVEKRDLWRVALTSFAWVLASYSVSATTRGAGTLMGTFLGIWLMIFLVRTIFATETKKAVKIVIFNFIASLIVAIVVLIIAMIISYSSIRW